MNILAFSLEASFCFGEEGKLFLFLLNVFLNFLRAGDADDDGDDVDGGDVTGDDHGGDDDVSIIVR